MGDLFASLNDKNISISQSPVTAKKMSQLIDSISSAVISGRTAKEVFEVMKETGEEPNKIIQSKGLQQKSDPKELEAIIEKILADNKDKVDQYKSGKDKLFGFFVGQVMKVSGGKANPQLVNEILKNKLK
jgi:aspartyl-tRNA(Asn)/glutamyl-tRNA(Gln) amidotransferase subunit B